MDIGSATSVAGVLAAYNALPENVKKELAAEGEELERLNKLHRPGLVIDEKMAELAKYVTIAATSPYATTINGADAKAQLANAQKAQKLIQEILADGHNGVVETAAQAKATAAKAVVDAFINASNDEAKVKAKYADVKAKIAKLESYVDEAYPAYQAKINELNAANPTPAIVLEAKPAFKTGAAKLEDESRYVSELGSKTVEEISAELDDVYAENVKLYNNFKVETAKPAKGAFTNWN